MEITLADLLVLEPRLTADGESRDPDLCEGRASAEVSWVVSARTTPPHLPSLRGGEVLLASSRVTAAVGAELPAFLREAQVRDVSAVVFERADVETRKTYPSSLGVRVLLWTGELTTDTETGFNRLLTECRGNLYRIGSEFERQMTDLAAKKSGITALVQVASELSRLPVVVVDAQGRRLATSGQARPDRLDANDPATEIRFERNVPGGLTLTLGPLLPEQSVTARFLVDRIAIAVAEAARRDDAARPRGARRAEMVGALLEGRYGNAAEQRAAALALGLDPDAVYFVAVSSGGTDSTVAKTLAPLGSVHPAGEQDGRRQVLIVTNGRAGSESLASQVNEVKRRLETGSEHATSTLALSAPAHGVARLPAAAREAAFVATLQAETPFPRRAASFESIDDVGAFRLLYPLRDSNELREFVSEALGTLQRRDQRGTLRATLRAFLESGGSQVDASNRLGIHRNTLAYRLRRIGELIGRDVADPGSWLTLHLALRASEMLDVISHDR
jgi:PucR family transcriptional regulator, purine catabolism regulatory protein